MTKYLEDKTLIAEYISFRKTSENTISSVIATARTSMQIFDDKIIAKIFSKDTLDIYKLREEYSVLYIICPEIMSNHYQIPLNLLYEEIFGTFLEGDVNENSIPITIMMDEAGNQTINGLDLTLSVSRKRKISICLLVQEISQLRDRYGIQKTQSMISGSISTHVVFPGLSVESSELYSRALGVSIKANTKNGSEIRKPLMSADAIRMLKGVILIHGASRPIKLSNIKPYYLDKKLKRLSEKPPFKRSESPVDEPPLLDFTKMEAGEELIGAADYEITEVENIVPLEDTSISPGPQKSEVIDIGTWRKNQAP